MFGLAVAIPLLLLAVLWHVSGFGGGPSPVFVIAGTVVGTTVVLVAVAAAKPCAIGLRIGAVLFGLVVCAVLAYWSISGGLAAFKLGGDVSSWQRTLHRLPEHSTSGPCFALTSPTVAGLGRVSQVCTSPESVDFVGSSGTNLVYDPRPGVSAGADDCVLHISGPWWETVPAPQDLDNGGECPAGFHVVGGG